MLRHCVAVLADEHDAAVVEHRQRRDRPPVPDDLAPRPHTSRLLDLTSAEAAVPVAVQGVASAMENLKVSRDRYRAGVIPSSELLDAETALLQSGLRKVDVLAQVRVAQARLARAVGE